MREPAQGAVASEAQRPNPFQRASGRFLQVMDLYLLLEGEDGLLVVDQHALHERVMYEQLKKQPQRLKAETRLWSKLLSWNLEVARGMERLESLNIVHRDLAARYLITKFPLRK